LATVTHEPEIIERESVPTLPSQVGGSVDVQVATAKRFPRSVESFMRRAQEMATLTPEIAASCVYALPRDGKMIEGPSARLAEIVASAWGNLRVQGGAEGDSEPNSPFIVGYGEAWDVETNTAVRFEVRRRITKSNGKRFGDDMIVVTGNAAASIALRNAVFKAVPSPFWRPIYLKCRQVIAGEAQTFASRRDEMVKKFNVMGVTNEQLYAVLGVKGLADVTLDHMVQITGAYNALREGELTVEEFVESGAAAAKSTPIQMPQRKEANGDKAQPPTADPAGVGRAKEAIYITHVERREASSTRDKSDEFVKSQGLTRRYFVLVVDSKGNAHYAWDSPQFPIEKLQPVWEQFRDSKRPVDIVSSKKSPADSMAEISEVVAL